MARFNGADLDHYGADSNTKFFSLKNDRDVATVRFLYNNIDDVEGYAIHQITLPDGKKRYVSCLRKYNEPVDNCPLCAAGYKVIAKLWVPVYDADADEVKLWERGKSFYSKLSSLCMRYNPLVGGTFEIERNGKPGDTQTRYEIYPVGTDETQLADLPEAPDPMGTIILDKTFEELQEFVETGTLSTSNSDSEEMPVRRRSAAPAGHAAEASAPAANTRATTRTQPGRAARPRRSVAARNDCEVF